MKTNASAFLQGYMNKEAGIGSALRGVAKRHAGLGVKGGLAGGAIIGGRKVMDKAEKAINSVGEKRKKALSGASEDTPKEKTKPTPAVRPNRKG